MPKYINADRLKAEETAAFEYAQAKMPNKIDRDLNEAVHVKLHRLLDDALAEDIVPVTYPCTIDDPQDTPIYDRIIIIRLSCSGVRETEQIFGDDYTLADIKVTKGEAVLVISEDPYGGEIYRYGNHGEFWEQIGITSGYA